MSLILLINYFTSICDKLLDVIEEYYIFFSICCYCTTFVVYIFYDSLSIYYSRFSTELIWYDHLKTFISYCQSLYQISFNYQFNVSSFVKSIIRILKTIDLYLEYILIFDIMFLCYSKNSYITLYLTFLIV